MLFHSLSVFLFGFVRGLVSSSAIFPTKKSILGIVKRVLNVGMPYIQYRQKESPANMLSFSLNCEKVLSCHLPLLSFWLQGPFIQNSNGALLCYVAAHKIFLTFVAVEMVESFKDSFLLFTTDLCIALHATFAAVNVTHLLHFCFLPTTVDKLLTTVCISSFHFSSTLTGLFVFFGSFFGGVLYKDTCSFLFELKSLGLPSGVTGWLGVSPGGRLGLPSGVAGWLGVPSGVTGWLGLPSGVAGWLGVPSGVAGWLGLPSGVAGWLRLASGGLAGSLTLTSDVHREPSRHL